ncbi:hypothetical protein MOQ_002413 [Trypanosoma cruzi marinkellei]|uniref:Uncharacterized protein n=1 Tax=Trypanosoma cruzi marinkellei TaxID=85056 RepID=K2N7E7_TRYCR|nr:hypothetical protein MOQ_002413 [Trypanosoma cruzi marinkellei]
MCAVLFFLYYCFIIIIIIIIFYSSLYIYIYVCVVDGLGFFLKGMIGCVPPAGFITGSDGRTLAPLVMSKGTPTQWVTSRSVEEGEVLWSECLFLFGVGEGGGRILMLTEDMEWNKTALMIWNAMVSKGGEKVTVWAVGFSALARALLVAGSHCPTITTMLVEPRSISLHADSVAVSLSTLLVKSYEKVKGSSPFTPIAATWLLIAMQEGSLPLHDPVGTGAVSLSCFLSFSRNVAKVPLKAASNASLFIESVTKAGEVRVCCKARKNIPAEAQVRLHVGRSLDASVTVEDNLQLDWGNYCYGMEGRLLRVA